MNTLSIESQLAKEYGYRPLKKELSIKYRQLFADNIPDGLPYINGGALRTKNGTLLCTAYRRIVIGDYGAFIEFSERQKATDYIVAPGQEYRLYDDRYSQNVKYIWLTVPDGSNIKIYHQKKPVKYADYLPGMYYVSVHEVVPE